eukprot:SAG31_NODE_10016_length_1195_cov_1.555657_2_plen_78_part_00
MTRKHTKFDEDGNIVTVIEEPAGPVLPSTTPPVANVEAVDEDSIDLGEMIEQIPFVGAEQVSCTFCIAAQCTLAVIK